MRSHSNIVELVLDRAATQTGDVLYTFLSFVAGGAGEERSLTFGDVEIRAKAIAVEMRSRLAQGDRALLVYEPGLDFILAFLGCQLAGVIAVPVYPPRKPEDMVRLAAIAKDCAAAAICTQQIYASAVETGLAVSPDLKSIVVLATDTADVASAALWRMPDVAPESLAFLQYTSGSTGVPKGVMVSHANLLHNEGCIARAFGSDRHDVGVVWLPQYHDMGLIGGILQPLYVGHRVVLMSPFDFLQRPLRWLEAISAFRATASGGPNFAYELCVRRASDEEIAGLDLASWRVAINGAEPVRRATLDRFATKFARCGFRREAYLPSYGLAESTLFVTGTSATEFPREIHVDAAALERHTLVCVDAAAPGSRALVGCGVARDQDVRIVDPSSSEPCADGRIGEIWVRSDSVARGYWNRPDATRETFAAFIGGAGGEGPFLRTGDFGVLHDGELFVTGRLKELIIVDGRNHYPQDIEETAQNDRPILRRGCGAAFSVDVDGAERLVVVHDVAKGSEGADLTRLAAEVRASVASTHGIAIHCLVLAPQGTVQKTSSGKIRRARMRELYVAGTLDTVLRSDAIDTKPIAATVATAVLSRTVLEKTIASLIASHVGIATRAIDVHTTFSAFGIDSLALVGLSGELERALGRRVEPQIFYKYATVAHLARFLADGDELSDVRAIDRSARALQANEPIAIVGMACRFPGAPNLDAFWELLREGRDAIVEVPSDRWDIADWFDPDPSVSGKMATRWGGFVDDVDRFDADFFGISAREAEAMDPQQRLLLQLAWHALEEAGVVASTLRGSRTGVFVGISGNDYARLQAGTPALAAPHACTGNALSIAANRLSYFLDLKGPSVAIDTACSSSLTAVHEAALHLLAGDCDVALVGGINLTLAPDVTVSCSQNRMMAADGRCKAFSKDADGYVRGEGGGVIVLKRLSDALAAGDRIWATIAGSACNQDGRSNGLTAPNGLAQRAVVREALDRAGWRPYDVQFVEAHGTGTRLGDPIEAEALGAAYGEMRSDSSPLILGAVKSQIGHLEAAAGIAGLIKTALCLAHGTIPANLHCAETNPLVRLDQWRLALPRSLRSWPATATRRAGVSAFGFGGTNAHVLLEESPPVAASPRDVASRPIHVLALSAKCEASLASSSIAHASRFAVDADVASLCHTSNTRREHFRDVRRAFVGATAEDFAAALAQPRDDDRRSPSKRAGVAFLFTGQGAQYVDMGRRLYETHAEFRAQIDACDVALRGKRAHSLLDLLYPAPEKKLAMDALLANTEYAQPALYAIEVALAALWRSWGVEPEVVMGHSLGEIAAAAVAGVFSVEDGLALVEARGRLMQSVPEAGGMLAVFAHQRDLDELLPHFAGRISIAAFNGPGQIVLSGATQALDRARLLFKQRGIEAKPLAVSHAFHSPLMQPMVDDFRRVAQSIRYHEPTIALVSNVTGRVESTKLTSPEYWVEHVLAPVRFADSVAEVARLDVGVLLEIGPRPVLVGMAKRIVSPAKHAFRGSLDAKTDDWSMLAESLAALYEAGVDVDWAAFDAPFASEVASGPLYPFETKRYWFDAQATGPAVARTTPGVHPLLGRSLSSPRMKQGERHYESEIRLPGPAFFRLTAEPVERRVSLLAFVDMALEAQHAISPSAARSVRDVTLDGLLQITRDDARTIQTICEPVGADAHCMEVWAKEASEWRRVAHATLDAIAEVESISEPLDSLRARMGRPLDVDAWYESTREAGFFYWASPHKAIRRLWWAPSEVLAEVTLHPEDDASSAGIWFKHSVWHACNQVLGALCPRDGHGTYFPVSLAGIRTFREMGRSLVIHARLVEHRTDPPSCVVHVTAYAEDGTPIVEVEGIRLIPDEAERRHRVEWRKAPPEARVDLLVETLRRVVARVFRRPVDEIPITESLAALGLDSLAAIDIGTSVDQMFEIGVDYASLQEGASVYELAIGLDQQLAEAEGWIRRPSSSDKSPLVDLNRGDASLAPLFLLHPTGGTVFCYQELARHLGSQPVVAVQSPAFAGSVQIFDNLESRAELYLAAIRSRQPHGPYLLGGWSMGGVLAFEIARQIEAAGEEVGCLLLLDALAPSDTSTRPEQAYVLRLLAQGLGIDLQGVATSVLEGDVDVALKSLLAIVRAQKDALRSLTLADFRRLLSEFERNLELLGGYAGRPYNGTATLLRAEIPLDPRRPRASGREWEKWVAGIDALHTVPGDHFSLLSASHVALTASYVRKTLREIAPRSSSHVAADRALTLPYPRAEKNVVIASPTRGHDGVARAQLVVDEEHPYFFDHPLDHVTGVLMIEGMLQLVEAADLTRDAYVRHLRVTFPRFCEKDRRTTFEIAATADGESRTCRALQDGLPVATMKFQTDRSPSPRDATCAPTSAPASARLLHKSRAENVFIGHVRVAAGRAESTLIAPPAHHLLAGGDQRNYSPLYALEATRQFVTALAHTEYQVPRGMPMNLVGTELILYAPVPRGATITLAHEVRSFGPATPNRFAHFDVALLSGDESIGRCRLTAQLMTQEAYLRVRRHKAVVAA